MKTLSKIFLAICLIVVANGYAQVKLGIPIPSEEIYIEIALKYERRLNEINKNKLELKELIDSKEEILKKLKVEV